LNATPGVKGFSSLPLRDRFFAKVDPADIGSKDRCWMWIGSVRGGRYPYGQLWSEGKTRMATQVSWELHHGKPFPTYLVACHTCDNPRCVNPLHIWPGTMKENTADAIRKGRLVSAGELARIRKENTTRLPIFGERMTMAEAAHLLMRTEGITLIWASNKALLTRAYLMAQTNGFTQNKPTTSKLKSVITSVIRSLLFRRSGVVRGPDVTGLRQVNHPAFALAQTNGDNNV